jgi:hypothetical protein
MIRSMKAIVPAALAAIGVAAPAQASVLQGTSEAYTAHLGASYSIPILGGATYDSGLINDLARSTPPMYNLNSPIASVTLQAPPSGFFAGDILTVTSGTLTTAIASNVDGGLGSRTTTADSMLEDASISLLTVGSAPSLLSITVGAIHQNATATGDYGTADAFGSLTIEDLVVKLGNTTIYSLLGVNTFTSQVNVVNASLANAGISLILNEQTPTDTFPMDPYIKGISTNALHLSFSASLLGVSAAGDVVLGHAQAYQSYAPNAVPEPASVAMMGLGVVGAGLAGLRRRKAA